MLLARAYMNVREYSYFCTEYCTSVRASTVLLLEYSSMILCIIYYTVLHTSARRCIVLAVPAKYLRREQKQSAMERTTRKLAKIDLTNDSSFFFSIISKTNLGYLWLAFNEMPKNHHIYKEALLLEVVMNFQWDACTSIWEIYFWFVVYIFFSKFFHFVYYRSRLYSVRLKGSHSMAWH